MPPPCSACQNDLAGPAGRGGDPTSWRRCWKRDSCSPMASSITSASGDVMRAGSSASAGVIACARISERVMIPPGTKKPALGGPWIDGLPCYQNQSRESDMGLTLTRREGEELELTFSETMSAAELEELL